MITLYRNEILYAIDLATHKIAKRYTDPDRANEIQSGEDDRDLLNSFINRHVENIRQIYPNSDGIVTDNKSGNEDDIVISFSFPDNSVKNTIVIEIQNYLVTSALFEYFKLTLPEEAERYGIAAEQSYAEVKSRIKRRMNIRRPTSWL